MSIKKEHRFVIRHIPPLSRQLHHHEFTTGPCCLEDYFDLEASILKLPPIQGAKVQNLVEISCRLVSELDEPKCHHIGLVVDNTEAHKLFQAYIDKDDSLEDGSFLRFTTGTRAIRLCNTKAAV